tara:strand:- start:356 stop:1198 length:843 start_codon:yes stop_codon:yes gene_type:complete
MKNFTIRLIFNLVLFALLLLFLIFSINIYLNNKHIESSLAKKNVSIIEISIASKTQDLVVSLGDLISENMLKELLKSRINIRSLSFEIRSAKKFVTSYNNFYIHNTSLMTKVDSEDNNKFYEVYKEEEANYEKLLRKIFLNKIKTINLMNNEFKTSLDDRIFTREDLKKIEQFDTIIKNPLFNNCKRFEVSPNLSVNEENYQNKNNINYSIQCLGEVDNLDPNKFIVKLSLTPYYEDTLKKQSINFVYLIYVILTFVFGLLLFLLNLSAIKLRFKLKSIN